MDGWAAVFDDTGLEAVVAAAMGEAVGLAGEGRLVELVEDILDTAWFEFVLESKSAISTFGAGALDKVADVCACRLSSLCCRRLL